MICYNGRFGWIPYTNLFGSNDSIKKLLEKHNKKDQDSKILNYEHLDGSVLCLNFRQDFKFTNETLNNLRRQVADIPQGQEIEDRLIVKFGTSTSSDQLDLMTFLRMF